jgi:hypothetical protein
MREQQGKTVFVQRGTLNHCDTLTPEWIGLKHLVLEFNWALTVNLVSLYKPWPPDFMLPAGSYLWSQQVVNTF